MSLAELSFHDLIVLTLCQGADAIHVTLRTDKRWLALLWSTSLADDTDDYGVSGANAGGTP